MGADAAEEEQFGPYAVYERLGVGGMATVHRAIEHGMAERTVALKRLLPHLAEDASFIKSFVREAKLASVLHHVNIVQIYELGRVGTEYFISMEYIDGRDIRRILRHARRVTGPPPINITVGMLLQLCDALDYAHTKHDDDGQPMQLVHRDVSPSNVLVTSQGHLKVIDFGIARAQSSQLRTQTGRVKGKLAYMAPEAVSGSRELDARSDIWAIGVIAHELLTARPLFASKNEYQTLLKVQRGDIIPPSTFNQAVPPELDAIVAKALERDADERYASAADMREDLMALRYRKGLSTSYRDISTWIEWAFSIEAPSGGFAATTSFEKTSGTGPQGAKTPAPMKRDEEEAVEMAWGGGEQASGKPIVLDDVPDVSTKHSQQIPAQRDRNDRDDIPSVAPQHDRVGTIGGVTPFDGEPRTNPSGPLVIEDSVDVDLDATPIPAPLPVPKKSRSATIAAAVPPPTRATPPAMRAARLSPPPATRPHSPSTPPLRPSGTITIPPLTARTSTPSQPPATRPTPPPPIATARASTPMPAQPEPTSPGMQALEPVRTPEPPAIQTKPGVGDAVPLVGRTKPSSAVRTKPGVGDITARAAKVSVPPVTIGQSMVERELAGSGTRRIWPWIAMLLVAGAGAAGVVVYLSRDGKKVEPAPAPAPQKLVGTVKFLTEPADAEIRIGSMAPHKGSPWAIELPAGTHQIEVHRDGFKAWLSSVELAGGETNTITVALGPLGGGGAAAQDATLALGASTPGLEAVLDGQMLGVKTPIKMPLKTGAHSISLRKDGIEVWRTQIAAVAATDYTFDPAFTPAKQAFRAQQAKVPTPVVVAPHEDEAPTPQVEAPKHELPPQVPQSQLTKPVAIAPAPMVELPKAEPAPERPMPPPPPTPTPTPTPPAPTVAVAPAVVAPSAVTKTAGDIPHLGVARNVDLPPVIAAKVCIDTDGKVTSAYAISKIEKHAAEDLGEVIKNTWRYAPYKQKGVAVPACFAVSFKTK